MRTARVLTVSPSMLCNGRGRVPGWGGCTWSGGVYLVRGAGVPSLGDVPGPRGDVPGPRGVYLVRGCTWSWGVYLVRGVYLVPGGVPGQVLPHCEQNHTHL